MNPQTSETADQAPSHLARGARSVSVQLPDGFKYAARLSSAAPKSDNWAALAGLRMAMALVVLLSHSHMVTTLPISRAALLGPFAAVLGFFIVSGYSIAASVEREKSGYYARRAKRILPVYLISYLAALAVYARFGHTIPLPHEAAIVASDPKALIGTGLLLQGFFVHTFWFLAPAWSLSIECLYYLFAPYLTRCRKQFFHASIAASAALFLLLHHFNRSHLPIQFELYGIGAICLAWAWLLGFALKRFAQDKLIQATTLILPVLLVWRDPNGGGVLSPATMLLATAIVVFSGRFQLPRWTIKPLNHLGDLSYPLYLIHWPLILMVAEWLNHTHRQSCPLLFLIALSLVAAEAIYLLIDAPVRRYRKSRAPLAEQLAAN